MNSVGIASGGGAGMNLAHCIVHGRTAYDLGEADAKRFAPVFNSVEHLMARAPEILGTHYEIAYPGRQLRTARDLRLSPLHASHAQDGAQFGQVYDWERPLYFGEPSSPKLRFGRPDWFDAVGREVRAAHEAAAVFDLSSFGKIDVQGSGAEAFLQFACASNMAKPVGRAVYTALLTAQGTYASDITAHRLGAQHYRLFVGTTAIRRDMAWLQRLADGFDVTLTDCTQDHAVIALMGPDAAQIAEDLGAPELNALGYFHVGPAHLAGCPVHAVRMSYVGEAGWEITMRADAASAVYAALRRAGAAPAGLYAQTSMRIEKGFSAMGHELDSDVSPVECGLDMLVSKTRDFHGAEALARRRGIARRTLVTVLFDDQTAVPLGHEPIYFGSDVIGLTTSASHGYRIGAPVALAHVDCDAPDGKRVEVEVTGQRYPARLQFAPAFDPEGLRMRRVYA